MSSHMTRKELAREALKLAHADGRQHKQIGDATGIDPGLLRSFKAGKSLGPENTIALLSYLTAQGYVVASDSDPALQDVAPVGGDPFRLLADKLIITARILQSPYYDGVYKVGELGKLARDLSEHFEAHIAAIHRADSQ